MAQSRDSVTGSSAVGPSVKCRTLGLPVTFCDTILGCATGIAGGFSTMAPKASERMPLKIKWFMVYLRLSEQFIDRAAAEIDGVLAAAGLGSGRAAPLFRQAPLRALAHDLQVQAQLHAVHVGHGHAVVHQRAVDGPQEFRRRQPMVLAWVVAAFGGKSATWSLT